MAIEKAALDRVSSGDGSAALVTHLLLEQVENPEDLESVRNAVKQWLSHLVKRCTGRAREYTEQGKEKSANIFNLSAEGWARELRKLESGEVCVLLERATGTRGVRIPRNMGEVTSEWIYGIS